MLPGQKGNLAPICTSNPKTDYTIEKYVQKHIKSTINMSQSELKRNSYTRLNLRMENCGKWITSIV